MIGNVQWTFWFCAVCRSPRNSLEVTSMFHWCSIPYSFLLLLSSTTVPTRPFIAAHESDVYPSTTKIIVTCFI